MQKPHVLQWLALGGLHMLHVEQYLQDNLASEGGTKGKVLEGCSHRFCLLPLRVFACKT